MKCEDCYNYSDQDRCPADCDPELLSEGNDAPCFGEVTSDLFNAIRDALWWVNNGIDNEDLDNLELKRTLKCRDRLKLFLGE